MTDEANSQQAVGLSIGALSKATGIPVETLRTWERRYGFPNPERNTSGHRVYSSATTERLKLIDHALKEGHRAAAALQMPLEELRELAHIDTRSPKPWMDAVMRFDGEGLEELMRRDWNTYGALDFLTGSLNPFLGDLGNAWMNNKVDIAHEHFASERVRDFLSHHWRPISDRSRGPRILAATLPSETHYLGLQMACTVLAIAGARIVYLGADTPVDDVSSAAQAQLVDAVCVSVSIAANRSMTVRDLNSLRRQLGDNVSIVAGGLGAPDELDGVTTIKDLEELLKWGRNLSKIHQPTRH